MNIVLNMVTGEVETMSPSLEVTAKKEYDWGTQPVVGLQLLPVASCSEDKWRAIETGMFSRPSVFF
ncbi:MAG: hypothetical protein ACYC2R_06690 [Burkholderiales bacterium]